MSEYRKRLSASAEDFDSIIHDLLTDYEALKEYIDSGASDDELVIEKNNEIQRLQDKLKNQCAECPLNRRYDDSDCMFLRRRAD